MPSENELLANNIEIIKKCVITFRQKVLKFLSLDGLYKALINEKRQPSYLNLVTIILLEIIQLNHTIKSGNKS